MKNLLIALAIVSLFGCASFTNNPQYQSSWRAGTFEAIGCEGVGFHGDHMAEHSACDELILISETSDIQLQPDINFGIEYTITPNDEAACMEKTFILEHPPMTQPNGSVTTQYSRSYKVGDCSDTDAFGVNVFAWNIAEEWEAVTGQWIFKILIDGDLIAKKEFSVR